jgi:RNA polymerase sigma-70 factor, ECF subfamily
MKPQEMISERPAALPRIDPDAILIDKIRNGSEAAFAELVERHHAAMVRLARSFISSAQAEEIAQDTWIAVLKGVQHFKGRSTFKTWLFRVVINRAISEAAREARANRLTVSVDNDRGERLTEAWHFYADDHARAGHWLVSPRPWSPEERLLTRETLAVVEATIDLLPALQRRVVNLRDVEGWTSIEVCDLLGISEGYQRVVLHRARIKLRNALEDFFSTKETS